MDYSDHANGMSEKNLWYETAIPAECEAPMKAAYVAARAWYEVIMTIRMQERQMLMLRFD